MSVPNLFVRRLLFTTALCTLLAACGSNADIKESLGLNRSAPDEFKVYARPPLTVPPDFSLRAPGTATDAPTATPASTQARNAVIGAGSEDMPSGISETAVPIVSSSELPTSADSQFLQNAGVHKANADVRSKITAESEDGVTPKNSNYFFNPSSTDEPMVDAGKEAERLKSNKELKKSPTEGETPVVEPKSKGILGRIGDWF